MHNIALITSHIEHLYLFRILQQYNFSYHVYYDQEGGEWFDKPQEFVIKRVQALCDRAIADGATKLILPPMLELQYMEDQKYAPYILPLFSRYVTEYCVPYSLIGKIGFLGEWFDAKHQFLVEKLCTTVEKTPAQTRTRSFQNPFAYWFKQVSMRKHFLVQLGWKDWMMHNVVKHDLRYFCDAGVDTIIPLHYGYHAYDVTIAKFIRTKKMRWHGLETVDMIFASLIQEGSVADIGVNTTTEYSVKISYTGTLDHLTAEKKWLWLLQKGANINIQSELIDI